MNELPVVDGHWIVGIIDEADADAVVGRNVERLHLVTLGKPAYAPFLDAGILEVF